MYMHTYGKPSDPAVVLLHPMGITAEKLYEIIGQKLTGRPTIRNGSTRRKCCFPASSSH